MSRPHMERARDRIAELSRQTRDLVSFWQEASMVVRHAVPHFSAPCWFTLDPASLLVTSHFGEGVPELPPESLAQEYYGDDVNKLVDVVRSPRGISTLHEATGGDPSRSPRWHENMALGADQEMIAALRTVGGQAWGAVGLYREPGEAMFTDEELSFVVSVSSHLAEGARRSLLFGEATDPEHPDAPGLLVLSEGWELESANPTAGIWLEELPDGDLTAGRLPSVVLAVAGQTLRATGSERGATAQLMGRSGTWIAVHGSLLASGNGPQVAVIVERADPARIVPVLMSAYGLTEREREITRLVLHGESTTAIATHLFISPYTVQEHLKNVFAKTGVRSRRDLVGKIFFAHYEPRLRDNERRALAGRPLRGGPFTRPIDATAASTRPTDPDDERRVRANV